MRTYTHIRRVYYKQSVEKTRLLLHTLHTLGKQSAERTRFLTHTHFNLLQAVG